MASNKSSQIGVGHKDDFVAKRAISHVQSVVPTITENAKHGGTSTIGLSPENLLKSTSRTETAMDVDQEEPKSYVPSTAEPEIILAEGVEKYNTLHRRRGVALIFNHQKYDHSQTFQRGGADNDGDALKGVLSLLSFEVRYHKDLSRDEIYAKLDEVAAENHTDSDCFLVAVMTIGRREGVLHARDGAYYIEDIWQRFTEDKVPSLDKKPKIFLFDACRMNEMGRRRGYYSNSVCGERPYHMPSNPDFIFAHFSMEGYYSWMGVEAGSWFVQELCNELKESARKKDLFTILAHTSRRIAAKRTVTNEGVQESEPRRKLPVVTSTLSKLLYFTTKA